jgi:hypothetical protein
VTRRRTATGKTIARYVGAIASLADATAVVLGRYLSAHRMGLHSAIGFYRCARALA